MASKTGASTSRMLFFSGLAFLILVLLGPVMNYSDSSTASNTGSIVRQIGYVLSLGALVYALWKRGDVAAALQLPIPIAIPVAWCWLSLSWAISPEIAFQRLVLTMIAFWYTFILVQGAGYREALKIFRIVLLLALVGNYLTVLIEPMVGIHLMKDTTALYGNWRGMMGHKNFAGAACAISVLLFVFDARDIKPWLRALVILASLHFLYMSQSKTSAGMVVIALLVGWVFSKFSMRLRQFAIPLLMVGSSVFFAVGSSYKILSVESVLNPKSFTGRGYIWSTILSYAQDHLVLGAGFGSFWKIGYASPILQYGRGFVAEVAAGHNGYLDLLVTIGLPGLVLVVLGFIVWPTWKLLTSGIANERGALACSVLVFCVGHNMTESSLLERDSFIGVMFYFAIAVVSSWQPIQRRNTESEGRDVFAVLRARARAGF